MKKTGALVSVAAVCGILAAASSAVAELQVLRAIPGGAPSGAPGIEAFTLDSAGSVSGEPVLIPLSTSREGVVAELAASGLAPELAALFAEEIERAVRDGEPVADLLAHAGSLLGEGGSGEDAVFALQAYALTLQDPAPAVVDFADFARNSSTDFRIEDVLETDAIPSDRCAGCETRKTLLVGATCGQIRGSVTRACPRDFFLGVFPPGQSYVSICPDFFTGCAGSANYASRISAYVEPCGFAVSDAGGCSDGRASGILVNNAGPGSFRVIIEVTGRTPGLDVGGYTLVHRRQ